MKRNIELVIAILEYLEARNDSHMVEIVPIEGYENPIIMYHQILIENAGFTFSERVVSKSTPERVIMSYPFDLTWKGHEFLAATRQKHVWAELKKHFGKNLREAPIDTVFELAKKLSKSYAEQKIAPLLGPTAAGD